MSLILLIRHGENDYVKKGRLPGRLPGIHLNEKGRSQAEALAEKLRGAPVKAIYSSPLERAMETAEPIARNHGLEIIQRPGLMDTDVGEWQGRTIKGLRRLKAWRQVQSAPSVMRFPGGETFRVTQQRIVDEIETLRLQYEEKDMFICVTHADPIKLAVAFYMGIPFDLFQRLAISPATITALQLGEYGGRLLTLNYDVSFTLSPP
jgi:probable phosphoglycerate mutase